MITLSPRDPASRAAFSPMPEVPPITARIRSLIVRSLQPADPEVLPVPDEHYEYRDGEIRTR
jgi:hypothetical protein